MELGWLLLLLLLLWVANSEQRAARLLSLILVTAMMPDGLQHMCPLDR